MKILLDECVTRKLKPFLTEYEVHTVAECGWNGIKNGTLMGLCREHAFDVLVTIDKNMVFQQHLKDLPVCIIVLNSITSKLEELVTFLPALKSILSSLEPSKAYVINAP